MTILEAALAYARRGWRVVPDHGITDALKCTCADPDCRVPGKHPRIELERREGSIDPEKIRAWWTQWPDSNVAIVCGWMSGLLVFDIDKKNGGYESLKDVQARFGALPLTCAVRSGGGGMHLYFKHPGGTTLRNRNGLYPGVDIRADGGRIVAPPSRHFSGSTYQWDQFYRPDKMTVADAPHWLLDQIQNSKGTGTPSALKKKTEAIERKRPSQNRETEEPAEEILVIHDVRGRGRW